ncbi:MAG: EAL domain-containing protein [Xanthobacteraceae bacterium]
MEDSEELRETLVAMRREMDLLRTETTHANLLLTALDTVLCVEGDDDPFAGVFVALMPVFACSCAIVLIERDDGVDTLECVASSHAAAVGSVWASSKIFHKVLSGRIVTTVSDSGVDVWPDIEGLTLSGKQPALYLPLGVRGRRGLMLLLRACGEPGFDRSQVTLARKFSLLASHAFAAKRASQTEAESQRLKHLTKQLKASQEALSFRANHDRLTGLPNRAYVQELVRDIIAHNRPGQKLALAFIDLDDFKRVNDAHGHAAGDTLLREVAERVRSVIGPTDVFGRISGDEFVIVLDPLAHRSEISLVINRVRDCLRRPLRIEDAEIRPSGSIGVALYPTHGEDYDTLRRHADMAMYRAKTSAKGSVAFFTRDLGRQASEKLSLEQQLRDAVSNREFCCALQQKVNIRSGDTIGFEALVRWIDGRGQMHAPYEFLPLAGELGLLDDITMLLADDLTRNLPDLEARFGEGVCYSINVSPAQAADIPFMLRLTRRLAETGRAERFILELTEESLAATGPFQTHVLPVLRSAGIAISIDDFGTGYSSLAKLAELTVDELKIDRSLVTAIHQRPRNQSILRAIESLGVALGISVVVEGIETAEENDYLTSRTKLDIGQGYLFHRPQLLGDLLDLREPAVASRHPGHAG